MTQPAKKQIETSLPAEVVMTWYQITLSAIGDAVLTTDPEGRITYMYPVAEELTGWVADEAHGQTLEAFFRIASEKDGRVGGTAGAESDRRRPGPRQGESHLTDLEGRHRAVDCRQRGAGPGRVGRAHRRGDGLQRRERVDDASTCTRVRAYVVIASMAHPSAAKRLERGPADPSIATRHKPRPAVSRSELE